MADRTFVFCGTEAGGLYRKEAGDAQWQELSNGLPPSPMTRSIAVHPKAPEMVHAGTQRGVYRSKDLGESWARMNFPEGRIIWSLKFHPRDPQVMYLGTEGCEVHRSEDDGENWEYLSTIATPDAVQMPFSTRILGLAMETSSPENMYAAMEVGGVARSLDGGNSWELTNAEFAEDVDLLDLHGVAVGSPNSEAVFISNRTGVWRTRDRGESWENCHLERFSQIRYSRGVQVSPNEPNTLYACIGANLRGDEGGVMRSTDLGESWERFDHGVTPNSTTFGISINVHHPEQVYFCTRKGQVIGTHDGGASWKEHLLPDSAQEVISVACTSV